jgi:hypothetical protein
MIIINTEHNGLLFFIAAYDIIRKTRVRDGSLEQQFLVLMNKMSIKLRRLRASSTIFTHMQGFWKP